MNSSTVVVLSVLQNVMIPDTAIPRAAHGDLAVTAVSVQWSSFVCLNAPDIASKCTMRGRKISFLFLLCYFNTKFTVKILFYSA